MLDNLDFSVRKENRWIFEKVEKKTEFINVKRYIKNNKFYYINDDYVYTNFYMGWGWEGIMW